MDKAEKIKEIIAEELGVQIEKVTLEANIKEDLGADSLDAIQLILAMEVEFDINIPDAEADKLTTVGDVIKYVEVQR